METIGLILWAIFIQIAIYVAIFCIYTKVINKFIRRNHVNLKRFTRKIRKSKTKTI